MKQTITFMLLLISSSVFAQELQPSATEALLNISTTNFKGIPIKMDFITIKGKTNEKAAFYFTSPGSKFSLLLPIDETYRIMFRNNGGDEDTVELNVPDMKYLTFDFTLKYEPPIIYKTFVLNIQFETGKSTLIPGSFSYLDEFYDTLKTYPDMIVEIGGHTDKIGDNHSNQKLSEARANVVRAYLLEKGIAPGRITAVGYGEMRPVASNDTPEGRQQNRRTEVKILNE